MKNYFGVFILLVLTFVFACSPTPIFVSDKVFDENYANYHNAYSNKEAKEIFEQILADKKITEDEYQQLCKIIIGKSTKEIREICGHPTMGKVYREPNPPDKSTVEAIAEYYIKTDSAIMGYDLFYVYINMHKEAISVHLGESPE